MNHEYSTGLSAVDQGMEQLWAAGSVVMNFPSSVKCDELLEW
jgi:hypothetical protein